MRPEDLKFYNPFGEVEKSLNKLPHWEQVGATYFITFRLADAVPLALRTKWKRERDIWLKFHPRPWNAGTEKEYHLRFSAQMDKWLDAGHGSCVLRQVECRAVAERVLRKYDEVRYIHGRFAVEMDRWVLKGVMGGFEMQLRLSDVMERRVRELEGVQRDEDRKQMGHGPRHAEAGEFSRDRSPQNGAQHQPDNRPSQALPSRGARSIDWDG